MSSTKSLTGHRVKLLTGDTELPARKEILEAFAPKANNAPTPPKQPIDVLVSTDVLSEGQNLQDANYCINYDLPWNPMKIVQRVGRIDRLMSDYKEVTAAVFFPEKELEALLGLLEKLEDKIQKISNVVGIESPILGEKENPKNFNAMHRIAIEDQTFIDDVERSSELLPSMTPFQFILSYLKKAGKVQLESIPLGKRSGKASDLNGIVLFYREKKEIEGMHLLFYDLNLQELQHINDVSWIFSRIRCKEDEQLKIPLAGYDAFKQFRVVDGKARSEIIKEINSAADYKEGLKIKPKNQGILFETLFQLYSQGRLSKDKVLPVYEILLRQNLVAFEQDFAEILNEYKKYKNPEALLGSVGGLIDRFKIQNRETVGRRKLQESDLIVVGYTFLSKTGEAFPMFEE